MVYVKENNTTEFARRRHALMTQMGDKSIAILPNAPPRLRNRDIFYPYRADSHFYYLTGFTEPHSVAVLIPNRPQGEFLLFCQEHDPEKELWEGQRVGLEDACTLYGADDAFPITDIDDILPGLLENRPRLYYALGCYPEFDPQVIGWMTHLREKERSGVSPPKETISLEHLIDTQRLRKSAQEVEWLRDAAAITVQAHRRAMQFCRPGLFEYELEAEILHEFFRHGCQAPAYPCIVGGGANACVLHYSANRAMLQDGELVLIDAGAEFNYYAADVSRTFPVNGRFSNAQKTIYSLVHYVQQAIIDKVRPGTFWNQLQETAVDLFTRGLVELGLLNGKVDTLIKEEAYKRFYMHRSGHWLGMDVHDVGGYKVDDQWRVLEPGMVLTVEPGLYIPAGLNDVPKQWWNIGVRIEDDVLVTEHGPEVLTAALPKAVEDIEALMARR